MPSEMLETFLGGFFYVPEVASIEMVVHAHLVGLVLETRNVTSAAKADSHTVRYS